jgi:hypothetical protein
MLTVAILINGQPIMARSAVNTGKVLGDGCVVYVVDDGSKIHHRPENGAVKLAEKLLKTIKEQKASNAKVRGPEAALSPEAPSRLAGSAATGHEAP